MNIKIKLLIPVILTLVVGAVAFSIYYLINKDLGISAPSGWLTHNSAGISFAYPAEFELKPNSSTILSNKNEEMNAKVDLTLTAPTQIEKYANAGDFCNSITQYYQELEANLPSTLNPFGDSSEAQQKSTDKIKVQNLEVIQINGKQVCRYELQGLTEETSSLVYSFFVRAGEKVGVMQAIITYGKSASKDDIEKMRQVVTTIQTENEIRLPEIQFPAI